MIELLYTALANVGPLDDVLVSVFGDLAGARIDDEFKQRQQFRKWRSGTIPENAHIERHVTVAHLAACLQLVKKMSRSKQVQKRAVYLNQSRARLEDVANSLRKSMTRLQTAKSGWESELASQRNHDRKAFEAAFLAYERGESDSDRILALNENAVQEIVARAGERDPLPDGFEDYLREQLTLEGQAYLPHFQASLGDVIKHGQEEFVRILNFKQQTAIRSQLTDLEEALKDTREHFEQILGQFMKLHAEATHVLHQPTLSAAPEVDSGVHYTKRTVELLGREIESKKLKLFVGDGRDRNFRWLQIAGVGGQGKSRMAYELYRDIEYPWVVGYLDTDDLKFFEEKGTSWQPNHPYLLIVDYVIGREEQIGLIIKILSKRTGSLEFPVRLILLERQRWDRGALSRNHSSFDSGNEPEVPESPGRADWFIKLSGRRDGGVASINESRFEDGVIELTHLDDDSLVKIVETTSASLGVELNADRSRLIDRLREIDAAGRPLYAYFLGYFFARDPNRVDLSLEQLLKDVLSKEQEDRWQKAYDSSNLKLGRNKKAFRLAAIATIAKELNCEEFTSKPYGFKISEKWRDRAQVLTDAPRGGLNDDHRITSLQPDLLGEWFVLSALARGLKTEKVVPQAWLVNPDNTAAFMQRLAQDFPTHKRTREVLEISTKEGIESYANVASSIVSSLGRSDIPKVTIQALKYGAKNDDGRAMRALGWCYLIGCGVKPNPKKAFSWFAIGATKAKDGGAMAYMGLCYQRGIAVKTNLEKSYLWYKKGANNKNGFAMAMLGNCLQRGRGVNQNTNDALYWYHRAADAGHGLGMAYLGVYHWKRGDAVEAFRWLRDGANTHNGFSTVQTGLCYELGFGTDRDPAIACEWYRKGIERGDGAAAVSLGICYQHGIGVEPDIKQAINFYKQGTELNNAYAMVCLGIVHERGLGELNDLDEAWHLHQAATQVANSDPTVPGNGAAHNSIGYRLISAEGAVRDVDMALKHFNNGAMLGNVHACVNLGICHLQRGEHNTARETFERAATLGEQLRQASLDRRHHAGVGMAQRLIKAPNDHLQIDEAVAFAHEKIAELA